MQAKGTFGLCEGVCGGGGGGNGLGNGDQVSLNVQQGCLLVQGEGVGEGPSSPPRQALEEVTGLQTTLDHLVQPQHSILAC